MKASSQQDESQMGEPGKYPNKPDQNKKNHQNVNYRVGVRVGVRVGERVRVRVRVRVIMMRYDYIIFYIISSR